MWWQRSEAGHHLIWYITCHVSRGTRYHTRWLWMGWCNVQCSVTRPPRWPMLSRVTMCHGSWQRDMGTTVFSWPGEVSRTLIHSYPRPRGAGRGDRCPVSRDKGKLIVYHNCATSARGKQIHSAKLHNVPVSNILSVCFPLPDLNENNREVLFRT